MSITLVILAHVSERAHSFGLGEIWRIGPGSLGVRVFFVISGFLITGILLTELGQTGSISLREFYLRRTFRIAPAFMFFLLAMTLLWLSGRARGLGGKWATHDLSGSDIVHAATYTSNYLRTSWLVGHSWSLSVEEQFYLLWPLLLVIVGAQRGALGAALMLIVSPIVRLIAAVWGNWPDSPQYAFECVADALATGCLLAIYRERIWTYSWYRRLSLSPFSRGWPLALLGVALASTRSTTWGEVVGISALNFLVAFGIDHSVRYPATGLGRFLNRPAAVYIGTLSYSLYLWQQPFLAPGLEWPNLYSLMGMFAASLISFHLIETPALRLRSKLFGRAARS